MKKECDFAVDGDPAMQKPPQRTGACGFFHTPVLTGGLKQDRLFAVSSFPRQTV